MKNKLKIKSMSGHIFDQVNDPSTLLKLDYLLKKYKIDKKIEPGRIIN